MTAQYTQRLGHTSCLLALEPNNYHEARVPPFRIVSIFVLCIAARSAGYMMNAFAIAGLITSLLPFFCTFVGQGLEVLDKVTSILSTILSGLVAKPIYVPAEPGVLKVLQAVVALALACHLRPPALFHFSRSIFGMPYHKSIDSDEFTDMPHSFQRVLYLIHKKTRCSVRCIRCLL